MSPLLLRIFAASFGALQMLVAAPGQPQVELLSDSLLPGERTNLLVRVPGTERAFLGELPDSPDVRLKLLGTSTPKSVHGRDTLFRFELRADKEGEVQIPSLPITVSGLRLNSPAKSFEVVSPQHLTWFKLPVAEQELEIGFRWRSGKSRLYPGESTPINLHLYLPDTASPPQLSYPRDRSSGLALEPLLPVNPDESANRPTGRTYLRGQLYHSFTYQSRAAALETGRLSLGPASAEALFTLRRRVRVQWRDLKISREITIPGVELEGLPFPVVPPPQFDGAIGRLKLEALLPVTSPVPGAPIEVELLVNGTGNLADLPAPRFTGAPPWQLVSMRRLAHSPDSPRRFQALVKHPGTPDELPGFELVYFAPDDARFLRTTTPPVPLDWQAGQAPRNAGATAPPRGPATPTTDPFAPINVDSASPRLQLSVTPPFWWHPAVAVAALLPLLVLIVAALRQRYLRRHPQSRLLAEIRQLPRKLPDHEYLKRLGNQLETGLPDKQRPEPIPEILALRDRHCFAPGKENFSLPPGQRRQWLKALSRALKLLLLGLGLGALAGGTPQAKAMPQDSGPAPAMPSADELVNRGSRYARQGDWAHAAACLRQALAAKPGHELAKQHLDLVEQNCSPELPAPSPWKTALARIRRHHYLYLSPVLALGGLYLLAFSCQHGKARNTRLGLALILLLAAAASFLTYRFYPTRYSSRELESLALTLPSTTLHSAPDSLAPSRRLPEASLLSISSRREPWLFVRLPDNSTAWVKAAELIPLDQPVPDYTNEGK